MIGRVVADDIPLRCTCQARPLLAVARCIRGRWLLHVKVFRQSRVDAELVVEWGTARIRCKACRRWYVVRVRSGDVTHRAEDLPFPSTALSSQR